MNAAQWERTSVITLTFNYRVKLTITTQQEAQSDITDLVHRYSTN